MPTDRTPRRPLRWATVTALSVAVVLAALYLAVLRPTAPSELPATTATLAAAPPTSRPVAADPTTTTATTTTVPPTTTTTTTTTAAPGDGSCHGEYVERHRVQEQCVLDRLQYIFEAVIAGTHAERMSVIRDGHMLAGVLANIEAFTEEYRGDMYPPFEGLWSGFEDADARPHRHIVVEGASWNGPNLLGVLIYMKPLPGQEPQLETWRAAPAVWVDGHWMVSYFAYCRVMGRMMEAKQSCPKDPRPHIPSEYGVRPEGSGAYRPLDLSDAESDALRNAPVW